MSLTAQEDLELGAGAQLDLAARALRFDDVIRYSWGGEVNLLSHAAISARAGASRIDLSASNNQAGSLTAVALDSAAGVVDLRGRSWRRAAANTTLAAPWCHTPRAASRSVPSGWARTVRQTAGCRSQPAPECRSGVRCGGFQIKQGDLNIGNDVRA
ncbi:hypothetical protein P4123_29320 [Pseudomonas aeruginosa]|nr:hypothetical protein [Pseudomonas aeruginosa]